MRVRPHVNPHTFYEQVDPFPWNEWGWNFDGLDVEIGSASGLFMQHYARSFPGRHVLGIEVRKPMVEVANQRLLQANLLNAKVVYGAAERVIQDGLRGCLIDSVFVFHPDPWFKKRHHNRRVIRHDFMDILEQKLRPNARLYLSTDVHELSEWIQTVLAQRPQWRMVQDDVFFREHYHTNWAYFSQVDLRDEWTAVYQFVSRGAEEK